MRCDKHRVRLRQVREGSNEFGAAPSHTVGATKNQACRCATARRVE